MYQLSPAHEKALLWLLALIQFTVIMDFMVMMPLGPQIMQAYSVGPAAFATAVSAYSWCSGISGLLAATYIDRFDRRQLLIASYLLFTFSNLACALSPTYEILLASRAFAGLAGGMMSSLVMTIISDVIPAQRRGEATGVVMTAFSMAAIAGVPGGIVLGAHFGWASAFYLLVILSLFIWLAAFKLVPSLTAHLNKETIPLSQVIPNLLELLQEKRHQIAYTLTFTVLVSHMLIIPFIAMVLVANHGIAPEEIMWIYMAGGAATFFSSRRVGKWSDRYGKHLMFRWISVISILPILFITHLPNLSLLAMIAFFPIFMVTMSGRMIPMQALLTTVPPGEKRGAFLSLNSAIQSIGTGCGAWLGGVLLSKTAGGQINGYGLNGWIAVGILLFAMFWVGLVRAKPVEQTTS